MKLSIKQLDYTILFLLTFIVLIDMINGFFIMKDYRLPISQGYKLVILGLVLLRLSISKEIYFALALILLFELSAFSGLLKHADISMFIKDLVFGAKWVNLPISYLYFKNLFQSSHFNILIEKFIKMIRFNFLFLALNMILGALGLGMSFYFHGYPNAVGTKGYIYAGNELTILVLSIYFLISVYLYNNKQYRKYLLFSLIFVLFAFLITSKTVIAGVLFIFLVPPFAKLRTRIKKEWISRLAYLVIYGTPFFILIIILGILNSGVLEKLKYSLRSNNYDILTVILSNRNRFVADGWHVFMKEYSLTEQVLGLGQQYHLNLSGHSAEVDFFSILFASGYIGLSTLLFVIFYWFLNVYRCFHLKGHDYVRACGILLIFITFTANLAGHIFGSGIAGIFIGISLATMHLKLDRDV